MQTISDAELSEYDIQLWIDNSGSMGGKSAVSDRSRHAAAQEFAAGFATFAATVDTDGITVGFFGATVHSVDNVTPDKVPTLFASNSPRGSTPLLAALKASIAKAQSGAKKSLIVVCTDGVPDEPQDLIAATIIDMTKSARDEGINILFVQFGDDPGATKFLAALDDNLTTAAYDAVDTKNERDIGALTTGQLMWAALND